MSGQRIEEWQDAVEAANGLFGDYSEPAIVPPLVRKRSGELTDCQRKLEEAEAKIAALDSALDDVWAAIGDALMSGNGIEAKYAQSVLKKVTAAREGVSDQARALLDKARKWDRFNEATEGRADGLDELLQDRDSLREQLARVTWERDDAANKALEAGQQLAASKARRTSHQNST